MTTNSARGRFRRSAARYRSVFVPDTSVWIVLPTLKRLRPSRAEGIPRFFSRGSSTAAPPLARGGNRGFAHSPAAFPYAGLADGQG